MRDAVQRAVRGRSDWVAIVLHLSRLAPPAPRPHHQRIARAVLGEAATRQGGQLFTLVNGDLALLFPSPEGGAGLAAAVANLFVADAPDPGLVLSRWTLPDRLGELAAFLDALPTIAAAPGTAERDGGLAAVTSLFEALEPRRVRDLLQRQTGVVVTQGGPERVLPVFREIRFSLPALEARAAASGHVAADPFLFRHLVAKLDPWLLGAVAADLEEGRPPTASSRSGTALHLNLSLETILSAEFEALTAMAARISVRVAVEVAVLEAFADADAFAAARRRIRAAGLAVVLDDVSHHALLVTRVAALEADAVKLDWSRQMLEVGPSLDRAVAAIDPQRVILHKADTEAAVRWGIAHDIRRFQGRHTDAILAAGRLAACPGAPGCTLRKCIEQEAGTTPAARSGCVNHRLLDAAVPEPVP